MMFDKKKKAAEAAAAEEKPVQKDAELSAEELEAEIAAEFDSVPEAEAEDQAEETPKADPVAEELARLTDNYQRLAAEYDNFRKRTVREKEALAGEVRAECISALLPVMDNLERALAADITSAEALHQGIEMVLTQTTAIFEKLGVEGYGEPGDEFDPNLHHGVSTASTGEYESGQITLVMQRGYSLNGKVIRPAMVQTEE